MKKITMVPDGALTGRFFRNFSSSSIDSHFPPNLLQPFIILRGHFIM